MPRRKALLIGINYFRSDNELKGCINDVNNVRDYLIRERGFPYDTYNMVVLTDDQQNPLYIPTRVNMMNAFQWLVTGNNPGDSVFLHYSGHGGQVQDPDGDRESGFDDTICPVDFQSAGQIDSDTLHRVLVSQLSPGVRCTVIFDCCHSGTAIELPFVYRSDEKGQIHLVDSVKQGLHLAQAARDLLRGGISMSKVREAKELVAGAKTFLQGFGGVISPQREGLGEEHFVEDWKAENRDVWMFSGCKDNQTSADATIGGQATGAMSWAFIRVMKENPNATYVEVLQKTRELLKQQYDQIPQLSVGGQFNLGQVVAF